MGFSVLGTLAVSAIVLLTAAVIGVLYWLKPPPQKVLIPSTIIWQKVLRERRRRSDFWRWLISLLLALSIGSLLALSLGSPFWGDSPGGERLVVVIDNGPTMGSRGASGRSRLERAEEVARSLVATLSDESQVLVADTGGQLGSSGFTSPRAALEEIRRLALSPRADVAFPANDYVEGRAKQTEEEPTRVVFVTDGVLIRDVPDGVQLISVFEEAPNVGITAFDLRPVPAEPDRFQALVELTNASASGRRVAVRIDGAGGKTLERRVDLAPGGRVSQLLELTDFVTGAVRCVIDSEDDGFTLDDVAYAYLPGGDGLSVYYVSQPLPSDDPEEEVLFNPYLESLLPHDRRLETRRLTPSDYSPELSPDLWVFDNFAPPQRPAEPVLVFRPPAAAWLGSSGEFSSPQRLVGTGQGHALLAHVDLSDVVVERGVALSPGQATLLAGTPSQPAILAMETGPRWVSLSFSPAESNFPQLDSFPVFMSNAVGWLTENDFLRATLGRLELSGPDAKVADAAGTPIPTRSLAGRTAFDIARPGMYQVELGPRRILVGASLLDAGVSRVNDSVTAGAASAGTDSDPIVERQSRELFIPFLMLVVLLMLVEWWSYHRRLTV